MNRKSTFDDDEDDLTDLLDSFDPTSKSLPLSATLPLPKKDKITNDPNIKNFSRAPKKNSFDIEDDYGSDLLGLDSPPEARKSLLSTAPLFSTSSIDTKTFSPKFMDPKISQLAPQKENIATRKKNILNSLLDEDLGYKGIDLKKDDILKDSRGDTGSTYSFGGYVPSAAAPSSRPQSAVKRSVHFEEEDEPTPIKNIATSTILNKKLPDDDWMSLVTKDTVVTKDKPNELINQVPKPKLAASFSKSISSFDKDGDEDDIFKSNLTEKNNSINFSEDLKINDDRKSQAKFLNLDKPSKIVTDSTDKKSTISSFLDEKDDDDFYRSLLGSKELNSDKKNQKIFEDKNTKKDLDTDGDGDDTDSFTLPWNKQILNEKRDKEKENSKEINVYNDQGKNMATKKPQNKNKSEKKENYNIETNIYSVENNSKIMELEADKEFLERMLANIKNQHEREIQLLKDGYEKRLELSEEASTKCQQRLKLELESMEHELIEKLKLLENEKTELFADRLKRIPQIEQEKNKEIERLKFLYRSEIENLRQEQDENLQRVIRLKNEEIQAIARTKDHTKELESAVDKVSLVGHKLQEVEQKYENNRENHITENFESIKYVKEQLEKQRQENEMEKSRLLQLIAKLELQLNHQINDLELAKWKIKEEEKDIKCSRNLYEEERTKLFDQISRDKIEFEKTKLKFMENQRLIMSEMEKEKLDLVESRTRFEVESKMNLDRDRMSASKIKQNRIELDSQMDLLYTQQSRLREDREVLEAAVKKFNRDLSEFETKKLDLDRQKTSLENLAKNLREKSKDLDAVSEELNRINEDNTKLFRETKLAEKEAVKKAQHLQNLLHELQILQGQIKSERIMLAKEKAQAIECIEKSICKDCSKSLVPYNPVTKSVPDYNTFAYKMDDTDVQRVQSILRSIQNDKEIRTWKTKAHEDKAFLDNESYFLEAIKHMPYFYHS